MFMRTRTARFHAVSLAFLLALSGCNNLDRIANAAHDDATQNTTSIRSLARAAPGAANLTPAIVAQNRNTEKLLSLRGVVGTGAGLDANGNPSVVVFVEQRGVAGIPAKLDGVPVTVVVSGRIEAVRPVSQGLAYGKGGRYGNVTGGGGGGVTDTSGSGTGGGTVDTSGTGGGTTGGGSVCNIIPPSSRFPRPVPIGVSTGNPFLSAGTIGARLRNNATGQLFVLSNNHVYANVNQVSIGVNVLQPGPYDGGLNHVDSIGSLAAYEIVKFCDASGYCPPNVIDAAIASTTAAKVDNATPCDGYGAPSSTTVTPLVGMAVKKYGRTTGLTVSTISAVNVYVKVSYGNGLTALFTGQVYIESGTFSSGGDSGSLIVSDAGNPVALLFAGNSTCSVGNPIGAVLTRFNASIDGI